MVVVVIVVITIVCTGPGKGDNPESVVHSVIRYSGVVGSDACYRQTDTHVQEERRVCVSKVKSQPTVRSESNNPVTCTACRGECNAHMEDNRIVRPEGKQRAGQLRKRWKETFTCFNEQTIGFYWGKGGGINNFSIRYNVGMYQGRIYGDERDRTVDPVD